MYIYICMYINTHIRKQLNLKPLRLRVPQDKSLLVDTIEIKKAQP